MNKELDLILENLVNQLINGGRVLLNKFLNEGCAILIPISSRIQKKKCILATILEKRFG